MKNFLAPTLAAAMTAASCPALCQTAQTSASGSAVAAADISAALQQVCLPVLRGANFGATARSASFRFIDGSWSRNLGSEGQIELMPPDAANPHLCSATITSPGSDAPALRTAVDTWAQDQTPKLGRAQFDVTVKGPAHEWVTSSWSVATPAGQESVVLSQQQPAEASASDMLTQSDLLVSLTPA
jgi:hypothetical protein